MKKYSYPRGMSPTIAMSYLSSKFQKYEAALPTIIEVISIGIGKDEILANLG